MQTYFRKTHLNCLNQIPIEALKQLRSFLAAVSAHQTICASIASSVSQIVGVTSYAISMTAYQFTVRSIILADVANLQFLLAFQGFCAVVGTRNYIAFGRLIAEIDRDVFQGGWRSLKLGKLLVNFIEIYKKELTLTLVGVLATEFTKLRGLP